MQYTKLGNSDIEISKLCVGCMSFGKPFADFHEWTLDPTETENVVRHALELGINFFDTANTYAHGTSEEYLGRAIKNCTARDKVVLASKVYFNEGHLSKNAINREIDGTLKRLGTDYLDLYIIHRFDYSTPIEETMYALDNLVKSGKVRAIGASATESEDYKVVLRVKELANKYEKTMTQIALAWQFKKGISSPIIGATKAKYFDDAAAALDIELTDEDVKFLEEPYVPHKIVGALSNEN